MSGTICLTIDGMTCPLMTLKSCPWTFCYPIPSLYKIVLGVGCRPPKDTILLRDELTFFLSFSFQERFVIGAFNADIITKTANNMLAQLNDILRLWCLSKMINESVRVSQIPRYIQVYTMVIMLVLLIITSLNK